VACFPTIDSISVQGIVYDQRDDKQKHSELDKQPRLECKSQYPNTAFLEEKVQFSLYDWTV